MDENGQIEPGGDGMHLPAQRFDVIARILKACLPTLQRLENFMDYLWARHHIEALGQCFLASPPKALKELQLCVVMTTFIKIRL